MKKRINSPAALLVLTLLLAPNHPANGAPKDSSYRLLKKLTLGGEGGWDYFEVEPSTGHIFIPRGTHIMVLDSEGKQLADIPDVKGAHAIVFAPELNRAFLSTDGSVTVLDLAALKVRSQVWLADEDPDAILYDSAVKRVFTFNGGGSQDATAIDAETGKVVGSIELGGKPETAQADGAGHVYVNIEDQNKIVAFDSRTLKVLNTWPVSPCEE